MTRSRRRGPIGKEETHDNTHTARSPSSPAATAASARRSCSALAEAGANIVIDYVANEQATEDLEKQVAALGDQAIGVDADVSKVEDLERLIDAAVKAFGRLDIMVNNAGVETRTSILDTTEAQYEKVMDDQPQERLLRHAARGQADDRPGRRRADHQHHLGPRGLADAGQHRRTACPRAACACSPAPPASSSAPHGITVVGVGPGAVATPINTSTMNDPAKMATLDAAIPLGRMAEPEEIGSVVAFLAGDGASYLTATTIFADGGIMHSSPGL